jgi:hypothetical protein
VRLLGLADLRRGPGAALLEATVALGFSEGVARAGLEAELAAWTAPGALDGLRAELPPGLPATRLPRTMLVVAARTLPASAMRAALMGRALGARVFVKTASGQEAVAEALAAADPEVVPRPFASLDLASRDAAISESDSIVVLGSDGAIAAMQHATPAGTAFTGYGHRLSAAWLARVDDAALTGLAADLCAWDQGGCLSPQVVWAPDPERTAAALAERVAELERALPMEVPDTAWPARHAARVKAEMLGRAFATETAVVAALERPDFISSPGYRFLWVLPADPSALTPVAPLLSTLALSGPVPPALPLGLRLCPPGQMQRPPLTWPHDGRPNLPPLLRP